MERSNQLVPSVDCKFHVPRPTICDMLKLDVPAWLGVLFCMLAVYPGFHPSTVVISLGFSLHGYVEIK